MEMENWKYVYEFHLADTCDDGQYFLGTCVRHRCRGASSNRQSDSRLAGTQEQQQQAISRKSALVCVTFFRKQLYAVELSAALLESPCEGGSDGYASSRDTNG